MKHVVITGANRGIGLELARIYSQLYPVTAICRSSSNELDAMQHVTVIKDVDMRSWATIQHAIEQCDRKIDLLICNAGIFEGGSTKLGNVSAKSMQEQFLINAVAPLMCVQAALDHLTRDAKIALITSRMGSMADNKSGGYYGYRMSKAALNAAGKSLAIDLAERGIPVAILHPGMVRTEMTGYAGHVTPQEAAEQLAARIDDMRLETSGQFRHARGEILPW
ncbi:MAG: short-chain dehydrogenase [Legionellales bacterium]|jgi:NAD(P)-dependent dehydrogenase (short-subunit alcohol dehydrogenase family)|nr:short-chain dehydrogenase [Legionellales bacterium]|tara:strand:- start:1193 stop:1858 length:666 start_codon:yes stop_codon:yes gene_type:complete